MSTAREKAVEAQVSSRDQAVEVLADCEHASWAHWQLYLFECCKTLDNGDKVIPVDLVERWARQINTPYANLSDSEKESDREEVRRALAALNAAGLVVVRAEDVGNIIDAAGYTKNTSFWEKHGYRECEDSLWAATCRRWGR